MKEPAEVLEVARERDDEAKVEDVMLVADSRYPPLLPWLVLFRLPRLSVRLPAVPGRSGIGLGLSRPAFRFSRERREKMAMRES